MLIILSIGSYDYVLERDLDEAQIAALLHMLRGGRELRYRSTADYNESRYVYDEQRTRIRVTFEDDSQVISEPEWDAFLKNHTTQPPLKKDGA